MFLILNKNSSAFLNSLTDNGEARIQAIEKAKGPSMWCSASAPMAGNCKVTSRLSISP